MGTRGFLGFVVDEAEKITYNHWDSYPSDLGHKVLDWLQSATADVEGTERVTQGARDLRVVDPRSKPTAEDIERLRKFADLSVSNGSLNDWYCLLRGTQGDLGGILRAGVIEDGSNFPANSLSAEWGYLIDLDAGRFEVYRGFQEAPHAKGRFATRKPAIRGFAPVALLASWPLVDLPTVGDFLAATGG